MRLSKKLRLLCLGYIFFAVTLIHTANAEELSLSVEDVLEGIRTRAELLKSVKVTFKHETYADHPVEREQSFLNMPLVRSRECDIKRLGQKMRVEATVHNLEDSKLHELEIFAWDGKISTGYGSIPSDPNIGLSGSVKSKKGGPYKTCYWQTPLEQEVFDLRKPLAEVFEDDAERGITWEWSLTGPERIGQYSAYCLNGNGVAGNNMDLQVWVDPIRDFAPVQLVLTLGFKSGPSITEKMTDVRLEQRDGVWIIAEAVCKFENPRMKDPRKRQFATRFSVKDYHVGVELSEDIFRVKFPKGTRVYDEILKTGYIVGDRVFITDEDGLGGIIPFDSVDHLNAMSEKVNVPKSVEYEANVSKSPTSDTPLHLKNILPAHSPHIKPDSNISGSHRWLRQSIYVIVACSIVACIYVLFRLLWKKQYATTNKS